LICLEDVKNCFQQQHSAHDPGNRSSNKLFTANIACGLLLLLGLLLLGLRCWRSSSRYAGVQLLDRTAAALGFICLQWLFTKQPTGSSMGSTAQHTLRCYAAEHVQP
jgi:hypothetical protein